MKRLSKREQQRIKTTREHYGKDAFKKFGKLGGRPKKKKGEK